MSKHENDSLQLLRNSLPGPNSRGSDIYNLRRHSWCAAAVQPDTPADKLQRDVSSVKHFVQERNEKSELKEVHESYSRSWENLKGLSSAEENLESIAANSTKQKDVKIRNSYDDPIHIMAEFTGLERRRKGEKHHASVKVNDVKRKAQVSKRRSGLNRYMSVPGPDDLQRTDSQSKSLNESSNDMSGKSSLRPMHAPKQRYLNSRHRRATVHYSSNGRPDIMELRRRSAANRNLGVLEARALEQFQDVCRDYLLHRLRQRNLANRIKLDRPQSKERWLFHEVIFITNELERSQKCRFYDISKQIGVTLRSEDVLRKVFFEISGEIVTTESNPPDHDNEETKNNSPNKNFLRNKDSSFHMLSYESRHVEITWGRLCAVLAVAGGLAIDCVKQGHADLVNCIVECVGEFAVEENILSWITNQGGWEALRGLTCDIRSERVHTDAYFARAVHLTFTFAMCTLAVVLGIVSLGGLGGGGEL